VNYIEEIEREARLTQVSILAGGEGKRMGLIGVPKPLIRLGGMTLLERCIHYVRDSGFNDIVVVASHDDVAREAERLGARTYLDHELPRLGKAKALLRALRANALSPDRRLLIIFPDDVFLDTTLLLRFLASHVEMTRLHGVLGSVAVTMGIRIPFGVVETNHSLIAKSFVEKPVLGIQVSVGLYILEPQALSMLAQLVDPDEPRRVEFEEVLMPRLAEQGLLHAYPVPEGVWIPVNTIKELEEAERILQPNGNLFI